VDPLEDDIEEELDAFVRDEEHAEGVLSHAQRPIMQVFAELGVSDRARLAISNVRERD
jgi:hypothetical protein